ncbi:MAG: YbjQ family protein [Planctomycetota bacterium]
MLVVTADEIVGREITETLGLVRGNTIRARHVGRDIVAGLRSIVGGEIHEYAKLMGEAREQALDRMVDEAKELGADAVVCVRFSTSVVIGGAAEMLAYGTAVKLN